jgi:type I restriction enzyme S subunit
MKINMKIENKDIKRVVPSLRFPEFRDAEGWPYQNGNILFQQTSNRTHNSDLPILAITQEHGAIPRNMIDYNVTVTEKSLESYKVVEKGDFIISLRSFQGGIEYSAYTGICSPAYIILRNRKDICHLFYAKYFKSHQLINDLNKNLEGIRDGKMVSYKQFSELLLPYPKNNEQQKIAYCLGSLDDLINAVKDKVEALKEYKKGLMQQLFPAEGKTTPTLRFPEFQNAEGWKSVILNDILKIGNGKDYKHLETGNIPVYGSGGYLTLVNNHLYEGESVCIGRKGTIDKPIFLTGKFWTVDTLFYTYSFNNCLPKFIYQIFQQINWYKYNEASGVPSLSKTTIGNINILIPKDIAEQERIVDCFSSVDELISAETDKLDQLKVHKKGLMQQLFPTLNK